MRTYHCDNCNQDFDTDVPESDVIAEFTRDFKQQPFNRDAVASLCDDCYNQVKQFWDAKEDTNDPGTNKHRTTTKNTDSPIRNRSDSSNDS